MLEDGRGIVGNLAHPDLTERPRRIRRASEAVVRVDCHHGLDPFDELRRHRVGRLEMGKVAHQVLVEDGAHFARVGRLTRGHGPSHCAHRVEVRPRPVVAPDVPNLLGGHVRRGTRDVVCVEVSPPNTVGVTREVGGCRQTEVGELDPSGCAVQQHVPRLDVPVNEAARVRMGQRIEHVDDDRLECRPPKPSGQRRDGTPVNQLHCEPRRTRESCRRSCLFVRDQAVVVDRGDAGVVELCGGTDFVPKGRDEAGVGDDIGTQNLERDRMRVHRMVSLKDGGHPPLAEHAPQGERPDGRAFLHELHFYRWRVHAHKQACRKRAG